MHYSAFATLLLQATPFGGGWRYAFWTMGLLLLGLVAAWTLQRRRAQGLPSAKDPAQAGADSADLQPALHHYTVEQAFGRAGSEYARQLLAEKAQLEALLTPPEPLPPLPTQPPTTTEPQGAADASGAATSADSGAQSQQQPAQPQASAEQPAPDTTAATVIPPQDAEIKAFSQQLSCPSELQAPAPPAPRKGRFASRAQAQAPAVINRIHKTRSTFFQPTGTGQFVPQTEELAA